MTGRGGWPLSVFLTPELEPFFGGTYWPPHGRGGHAGLRPGAAAVADAWQQPPRRRCSRQAGNGRRSSCATNRLADERPAELSSATAPLEAAEDAPGRGRSIRGSAASAPRRNFPSPPTSALLLRPLAAARGATTSGDGHRHAGPHGRRRHLRSSRRRLSSLQRRRPLAGAALREDALRQRPAGRLLPGGLAGHAATPTTPAWSAKRWTTCSAT